MLSRRCWTHRFNQSGDRHNLPCPRSPVPPLTLPLTPPAALHSLPLQLQLRLVIFCPDQSQQSALGIAWQQEDKARQVTHYEVMGGVCGGSVYQEGRVNLHWRCKVCNAYFYSTSVCPVLGSVDQTYPIPQSHTKAEFSHLPDSRFICSQPQHIQRGIYAYIYIQ